MSNTDEMKGLLRDVLMRVRQDARHGKPPMIQSELAVFCGSSMAFAADVREAEREGRELLASGAPCMCIDCLSRLSGAVEKERLRLRYAARRHSELEIAGVASSAERSRLIQAEIDSGAALQEAPTTINRTGAA